MIEVRNSSIFQSRNVTIPFEIIVSIWKIQRISTFLRCFFPKIFFDSIRKIQNYCISLSGNYFFFFPRKNFRPPSVFEDLEIEKDWRRGREREREREREEVHREKRVESLERDRILDPSDSMTSGSLSTTTTTTDRIFMSGEETSADHGVVFAAVTTEILMGRIEIVMITASLFIARPFHPSPPFF